MKLFKLEKRKTNPKALYAACMVGLSIAIPTLILAPRVIEASQATTITEGSPAIYDGRPGWRVHKIEDGMATITELGPDIPVTVPYSDLEIDPRWVAEEYRWYLTFR